MRNAGFEVGRPLTSGTGVDTSDDYEEILLDPMKRPDERPVLDFPNVGIFVGLPILAAALQVQGERYAVVDAAMHPQAASMTYFEARAAARTTGAAIVAQYEVTS